MNEQGFVFRPRYADPRTEAELGKERLQRGIGPTERGSGTTRGYRRPAGAGTVTQSVDFIGASLCALVVGAARRQ